MTQSYDKYAPFLCLQENLRKIHNFYCIKIIWSIGPTYWDKVKNNLRENQQS